MKKGQIILVFVTSLMCGYTAWAGTSSQTSIAPAPEILGCWKQNDDYQIRFEQRRMVSVYKGKMLIARVISYDAGRVVLANMGPFPPIPYSITTIAGKRILTLQDGTTRILTELSDVPDALVIRPLSLGKPDKLPAERIKEIKADLAARWKQRNDIADSGNWGSYGKVLNENSAWMKKLVGEVGWIDAERFDAEAAKAAFGMARDSLDRQLMMAACPEILKDVKSGKLDSKEYAEFYDCLQGMLCLNQRYGTQIPREGGKTIVFRLEDPEKVEAYRKEMKLNSFKDFLAELESDGQTVEVKKE